MSFHGDPVGKGGASNQGGKLRPQLVSYGDTVEIVGTSGYDFGFGVADPTHYITVVPFDDAVGGQPTSADPILSNFAITESANGEYNIGSPAGKISFDASNNYPGATIFAVDDGVPKLRIEGALFPREHRFYLLGVGRNTSGGPTLVEGDVIDFVLVFVQRKRLEVFEVSVAGIDTTTLDIALALAGHNCKMREPTFINGIVATRKLVGFSRGLDGVNNPELETLADNTGIGSLAQNVTSTPDSYYNVALDESSDA